MPYPYDSSYDSENPELEPEPQHVESPESRFAGGTEEPQAIPEPDPETVHRAMEAERRRRQGIIDQQVRERVVQEILERGDNRPTQPNRPNWNRHTYSSNGVINPQYDFRRTPFLGGNNNNGPFGSNENFWRSWGNLAEEMNRTLTPEERRRKDADRARWRAERERNERMDRLNPNWRPGQDRDITLLDVAGAVGWIYGIGWGGGFWNTVRNKTLTGMGEEVWRNR